MRFFQRVYDRVLAWVAHPKAPWLLALVSTTEAIIFPIPPDVMLAPMCLSQPQKAWRLAALCTLTSVFGAVIGYCLGHFLGFWIRPWLEQSHYAPAYQAVVTAFAEYGVVYLVLAGFSPIPFKVFTVSAGLLRMSLLPFILAALIGRAGRFFLVAGLIRLGGPNAAQYLRRWVDWLGWSILIIAGIGLILWRWHG